MSTRLTLHGTRQLAELGRRHGLSQEMIFDAQVVAQVLPFRTNDYVLRELIDWERVPDDPIFQLVFFVRDMLRPQHFSRIADAIRSGAPQARLDEIVRDIRLELNPDSSRQSTNVPRLGQTPVAGVQHKYAETCLIMPSNGQTCFAYCTYCFRWPQFVALDEFHFATDEAARFLEYIRRHREITDVLLTGGDPLLMDARVLARYVEPLLTPEFSHIQSIRIGTKALGFWPYRFLTDHDADDLLALFRRVVASGRSLAFMAHFSHWRELTTDACGRAVARILESGATIRTQAPLVRHVNDSAEVWSRMWREQVRLGMYPYYMFIERDTGPNHYFQVPLIRALDIYRGAMMHVSGLARTARGPVMSADPGKISIDGIAYFGEEPVFVLSFLQARNPDWVRRPFFARLDPSAAWISGLQPAFGERQFFFERAGQQVPRRDGSRHDVPAGAI
ncbi:MAG TPA: lysine 2,3-aminomutase [Thermoanaerobaculia bacterium]|nr:lysine 2,3-aminomutase [Thermoanaerobaculia bacterium]